MAGMAWCMKLLLFNGADICRWLSPQSYSVKYMRSIEKPEWFWLVGWSSGPRFKVTIHDSWRHVHDLALRPCRLISNITRASRCAMVVTALKRCLAFWVVWPGSTRLAANTSTNRTSISQSSTRHGEDAQWRVYQAWALAGMAFKSIGNVGSEDYFPSVINQHSTLHCPVVYTVLHLCSKFLCDTGHCKGVPWKLLEWQNMYWYCLSLLDHTGTLCLNGIGHENLWRMCCGKCALPFAKVRLGGKAQCRTVMSACRVLCCTRNCFVAALVLLLLFI